MAVERRCQQVGAIPTDEIGPAERGKGECFASPQEMEGDGWNHWTFKNAQYPVDTADVIMYMAVSHL